MLPEFAMDLCHDQGTRSMLKGRLIALLMNLQKCVKHPDIVETSMSAAWAPAELFLQGLPFTSGVWLAQFPISIRAFPC